MTVSAVVIGHNDPQGVATIISQLRPQVDEIITITCCDNQSTGDITVYDAHHDDVGQSKCDIGIRLATKDYVLLASSDDEYLPDFVKDMQGHTEDLLLGGFQSHLVGTVTNSTPSLGRVTRGSFLVRREKALEVGYNHRNYEGDGLFIEDMVRNGATWVAIDKVNYIHK